MDGLGDLRSLNDGAIEQLLDWRPEHGVISVYLVIDPADRRDSWRTVLKDQLNEIVEAEWDPTGRRRVPLAATAERIQEHFLDEVPPFERLQIGFCEVAEKDGRDVWTSAQMRREMTEIVDLDHPYLIPLLGLLDEGAPIGVAAISAERVRLFEWVLGRLTDLEDWEAVLFMPDWREKKAQSSPDPARVHGPSASGHDQFDQRLDANRERFLEQVGGLVAEQALGRRWRRVLAFGAAHQVGRLQQGVRDRVELDLADEVDIVSENDRGRILERVEAAVERHNRRREMALVQAAVEAALTPAGRGATGLDEIERSLTEGRVRHLLFDAQSRGRDVRQMEEQLVDRALRTSAEVTPVEGEAAEMLREHGGIAALLRY
ncbi:MAG: VLRF1 family aeRF1-type release factor [Solirubrobacterales bacterium]